MRVPDASTLATAQVIDGNVQVQFNRNHVEDASVKSHVDENGDTCILGISFTPAVGPDGRRYLTLNTGKKLASDEVLCERLVAPRPHPDAWVEHINGDLADDSAGNLRWMTAELASWTVPEGIFVVQDNMTVLDIHAISYAVAPNDDQGVAFLEAPRRDTAADTVRNFMANLHMMETPGNEALGQPTPITFPGTVVQKDMCVVILNARGERVLAPPGSSCKNPTLYAPVGGSHVYAAFEDGIVARLHEPRMGAEASIFLEDMR